MFRDCPDFHVYTKPVSFLFHSPLPQPAGRLRFDLDMRETYSDCMHGLHSAAEHPAPVSHLRPLTPCQQMKSALPLYSLSGTLKADVPDASSTSALLLSLFVLFVLQHISTESWLTVAAVGDGLSASYYQQSVLYLPPHLAVSVALGWSHYWIWQPFVCTESLCRLFDITVAKVEMQLPTKGADACIQKAFYVISGKWTNKCPCRQQRLVWTK